MGHFSDFEGCFFEGCCLLGVLLYGCLWVLVVLSGIFNTTGTFLGKKSPSYRSGSWMFTRVLSPNKAVQDFWWGKRIKSPKAQKQRLKQSKMLLPRPLKQVASGWTSFGTVDCLLVTCGSPLKYPSEPPIKPSKQTREVVFTPKRDFFGQKQQMAPLETPKTRLKTSKKR